MRAWKSVACLVAVIVAVIGGLIAVPARAAIVIHGTRVIYPEASRQVTVRLNNVETRPVLVQAWIDDGDTSVPVNEIRVPFVLTPPVFRVEPKKGQTLRVMFTGNQELPNDRESVYWLNVLEIPPKPLDANDRNMLQLAFCTRIKVFYRPAALQESPASHTQKLRWKAGRNAEGKHVLRVENPSAYYMSLDSVSVKTGDRQVEYRVNMAPPFGHVELVAEKDGAAVGSGATVSFSLLNDYGAAVKDTAVVE